jgi:hypothetical protein
MFAGQLALTLALLCLCGFVPGFFLLRKARWSPLERLCGSVGLSLVLDWLILWGIDVLAPRFWAVGCVVFSMACAFVGALLWRDARALFGVIRVRQTAAAFGLLLLWALIILASIRHYSGAAWFGDWLEHFQRTLVFLKHLPVETEIFGGYRIPSRPPLAHVLTAFLMTQAGDGFEIYQVAFAFLTLLSFIPCCLLLPLIAGSRKPAVRRGIPLLAYIFAMSPVMMINATFSGAKPITAFFEVAAIAFYLRGWKKGDRSRLTLAFTLSAGGALAHYSGLPYLVFLGGHYLVAVFRHRPDRWKELAHIAAAAGVPLVAWFGWCFLRFGTWNTFTTVSQASVVYGHIYEGGFLMKFLLNLVDAVVPHIRDHALVKVWRQPNPLGFLRDNAFQIEQTNLIFTMGWIGGPLVYWLLFRSLRHRTERTFWVWLVPYSIAANFALSSERDPFGVAHITLITMMAIGLTFLAANLISSRRLALIVAAGCLADFSLGILLETRIEHLDSAAGGPVFARIQVSGVGMDIAPLGAETLSRRAGANWFRKHQYALSEKWLAGLAASHPDGRGITPAQQSVRQTLEEVIAQDTTMFGGWYQSHGGALTFWGDHFADSDIPSLLLVAGAILILWKLASFTPPRLVAASPRPPPLAARARKGR